MIKISKSAAVQFLATVFFLGFIGFSQESLAAPSRSSPASFSDLSRRCAPEVPVSTMKALVATESGFNPFAIGVVGGRVRQPKSAAEADAAVKALDAQGFNYSVGLAQINLKNFDRFGLTRESAFDPCLNLSTGALILSECYASTAKSLTEAGRLSQALSCYYSGSRTSPAGHQYANRVARSAAIRTAIPPSLESLPEKDTHQVF